MKQKTREIVHPINSDDSTSADRSSFSRLNDEQADQTSTATCQLMQGVADQAEYKLKIVAIQRLEMWL